MRRRSGVTALTGMLVAAGLAVLTGVAPVAVAGSAPAPGTLTTFAGGLGQGPATNVAQSPSGITARGGRLVSVQTAFELGPMGAPSIRPGVVRSMDLATGHQEVIAGLSTGGFRGDGGPATMAQFNFPTDAAIDAAGNVYVTDTDNHRVRRVTPSGTITTLAGNGEAGFSGEGAAATAASINFPMGIAVSPSGDVVFADRGNYRVRQVSPSGRITTIAGTGAREGPVGDGGPATAALLEPWAVGFDEAGNLYVTDRMHSSLRRILVDGTITTVPIPSTSSYLAVDGPGNLYLHASTGIVKMDPEGAVTHFAGRIGTPPPGAGNGDGGPATDAYHLVATDLAFDGGNVYLADRHTHRIRRVDAAGIITTVAGNGFSDYGGDGGQARDAQFRSVSLLRSGPTGTYVFTADQIRDRGTLRRVDASGVVSLIYTGDVRGLAVDDAGNVFLSTPGRVRRLTPSGALSTVAGTGRAGSQGDGGPALLADVAPSALAVDGAGNLYLANGARIRRVDPSGIITTFVGGLTYDMWTATSLARETFLHEVWDLAVDADGSLLWIEGHSPVGMEVRKVRCGIVTSVLGTFFPTLTPGNLAVDATGSVFFVTGEEVRRAGPDGSPSRVAGAGGSLPFEGVPATSVALRYPSQVAIHASGRLLFGNDGRVLQVDGVSGTPAVPGRPCDTPDRPASGAGWNALGQLGDGTVTDRAIPSPDAPAFTGATAVSGGVGHSTALRADGTVWAAGWNAVGQLGEGTATDRARAAPVPGLTGVVAVAAGGYHSLALRSDGTVWVWGWNAFGQLGDGTTTTRLRPVRVPGLSGVVAISGGLLHSLAVRSDGSVWAWGWNGVGQLGDGTVVSRMLPTRVPGITGVTAVGSGYLHSLAVRSDGSVLAWGWNNVGQLGDGTTVERHAPVRAVGLGNVKAVAAGLYHSLALTNGGTIAGWGLSHLGQVGNSSPAGSLTPVNLPSVTVTNSTAVAIAAGALHSLAVLANGRVMAWGWNGYGQLAQPGGANWDHPVETPVLEHAVAVGVGAYHSLFAFNLTP